MWGDAWHTGKHILLPGMPPVLQCGFESPVRFECSGFEYITFSEVHCFIIISTLSFNLSVIADVRCLIVRCSLSQVTLRCNWQVWRRRSLCLSLPWVGASSAVPTYLWFLAPTCCTSPGTADSCGGLRTRCGKSSLSLFCGSVLVVLHPVKLSRKMNYDSLWDGVCNKKKRKKRSHMHISH